MLNARNPRTPARRLAAVALVTLALAPACSGSEGETAGESDTAADTDTDTDGTSGYTWWRDVEPVVRERCVTCHSPGNIGPFSLATYDEFINLAPILAPAIENGSMPPWLPDDECHTYKNSLELDLDQEALLLDYLAGDMPEGDPADAPSEGDPAPELVPDVVLEMPVSFTPTDSPDDYRCFTIPWPAEFTEDTFITGTQIYPGERAIVHHVILFVAEANEASEYEDLDAAEPGPGYRCFGGPGGNPGNVEWVTAWVPGTPPNLTPEGVGQRIKPGSTLIMQVHYNTSGGAGLADRSSVGFTVAPTVDRPAVLMPMADISWITGGTMDIPAGDPNVTHETTWTREHPILAARLGELGVGPDDDFLLHDVGLHMHLFGKRGRLGHRRSDGEDTCLVDIPDWDFAWQYNYQLAEAISVGPDDELHLQCWWDNSAENQPIIGGEKLEPVDRNWGDGTLDEMCLGVLYVSAVE